MRSQFHRSVLLGLLLLSPTLHAAEGMTASVPMLTGACVACHGPNGNSVGPAIPSLAGMSATYFIGTMLSYKHADDLEQARAIVEADLALEDVEIFARNSTIMNRLAGGYTVEDIKAMANYFEGMEMVPAPQTFDADLALEGEALHADNCEKCHEDGGRSTEDGMMSLAGQWATYLHYSLDDFTAGHREMPKKMKSRLSDVMEENGSHNLTSLINYYASQQ